MTTDQILFGFELLLVLAVGSQVLAGKLAPVTSTTTPSAAEGDTISHLGQRARRFAHRPGDQL
jgi:hypothetical protein